MGCFPQKFGNQINEFRVGISLSQEVEIGENFFEEFEEVVSFLLSDWELKGSGNGDQDMKHGDQIFVGSNFGNDGIDGDPCFVLMPDNDADDFLVELDEFVAVGASDHGHDDDLFYLLFLFGIDLELFCLPASLHRVFKLDQGGLLHSLINVHVVHYFHQSHRVA